MSEPLGAVRQCEVVECTLLKHYYIAKQRIAFFEQKKLTPFYLSFFSDK
jgi:hypothetical protein